MEKPLSIKREEFVQNLVALINNSGLPVFVAADILSQIASDANQLAREQLAKDKAAWAKEQEDGTDNIG
jgi:hypothetical protein